MLSTSGKQQPNEYNPFEELDHCFQDLNNFASIGPNSWIRLSKKTGHFIQTGGIWGNLPGIQSLAATYRGEADPDCVMLENFQLFTDKITQAVLEIFKIGSMTEREDSRKMCFLKLVEAQQRFFYALRGKAKNPEGGLNGILATYAANPEIHESLSANINNIKIAVAEAFSKSRMWFDVDGRISLDWSKEWNSDEVNTQDPEAPSTWKYYTSYTIPLAYNQASYYLPNSNWRPWDVVYTHDNECKLVLGGLPCVINNLKSGETVRDDLKDFLEVGINSILSVVERFEMSSPGWVIDPITPEVWEKNGINQLELPVPDFGTTGLAAIEKGIDYIHQELSAGRSVYVHCKAGRGRSYMLVVCYLVKYGNLSLKQAMELVKARRPQVNLESGDEKMGSIHQFAYIYDPSFEYDPKFKLSTAKTEGKITEEGFTLLEATVDVGEDLPEQVESMPQSTDEGPTKENCIVS